jgi:hypothetical protein
VTPPTHPARPAWLPSLVGAVLLLGLGLLMIGYRQWRIVGADEGYELIKALIFLNHPEDVPRMWNDQPSFSSILLARIFKVTGPIADIPRYGALFAFSAMLLGVARSHPHGNRWSVGLMIPILIAGYPRLFPLISSAMLEPLVVAGGIGSALLFRQALRRGSLALLGVAAAMGGIVLNIKLTAVSGLFLVVPMALCSRFEGQNTVGMGSRVKAFLVYASIVAGVWGVLFFATGNDSHAMYLSHVASRVSEVSRSEPLRFNPLKELAVSPICLFGAALGIVFAYRDETLQEWVSLWTIELGFVLCLFLAYGIWWDYYLLHLAVPLVALASAGFDSGIRLLLGISLKGTGPRWVFRGGLIFAVSGVLLALGDEVEDSRKTFSVNNRLFPAAFIRLLSDKASQIRYLYADRPIIGFHLGVTPPPELAVIPSKRFWSGQISEEQIVQTAEKYRPEVIFLSDPGEEAARKWMKLFETGYIRVYRDDSGQGWALRRLGLPERSQRDDIHRLQRMRL